MILEKINSSSEWKDNTEKLYDEMMKIVWWKLNSKLTIASMKTAFIISMWN